MTAKKPADLRQNRRTQDLGLVAVSRAASPVPAADPSWRPEAVEQWRAFWSSPLAGQVAESDHVALRRLWWLYDELDRLREAIDETGRVVPGSQGQLRPNPLFKQCEAFQAEARQLEDRFGLSPLARLRLGITFADAHASLDALNARLAASIDDDDDTWDDDES